jgi:Ran GTPase-activating protein (RanGAP) involved in mRNA processing and transport
MKLDLSNCGIGVLGGKAIAQNLPRSALADLNLSANNIGDVAVRALAQGLKVSRLRKLNLKECDVTCVGATALANGACTSPMLHELGLAGNSIGDDGAAAFGKVLSSLVSKLISLDLADNSIGPAGGRALGNGMRRNTTLQRFMLGFNSIGDQGADALGEALVCNASLIQLDVRANLISVTETLPECLIPNVTLQDLNLSVNQLASVTVRYSLLRTWMCV